MWKKSDYFNSSTNIFNSKRCIWLNLPNFKTNHTRQKWRWTDNKKIKEKTVQYVAYKTISIRLIRLSFQHWTNVEKLIDFFSHSDRFVALELYRANANGGMNTAKFAKCQTYVTSWKERERERGNENIWTHMAILEYYATTLIWMQHKWNCGMTQWQ